MKKFENMYKNRSDIVEISRKKVDLRECNREEINSNF